MGEPRGGDSPRLLQGPGRTLKEKNKEIIDSDRQAMQSMVSSQERVVAAYRNAANAALRIVQESQNRHVHVGRSVFRPAVQEVDRQGRGV